MTRKLVASLLLFVVAAIASAQVLDQPVAIVRLTKTVNIGIRELEGQLAVFQQQLGRELQAEEKRQILDALVNDELLLQAAERASIRVSQDEIQNYLSVQRQQWSQAIGEMLTEEQFRQRVEQETGESWSGFVADVTDELIKLKYVRQEKADVFQSQGGVTEAEVRDVYDEQTTSFTNPAMVSFRHVYVDLRGKSDDERAAARELLEGYRRQLRNGSLTFEELERRALDDASISVDDFGYLMRNDARSQQLLGRAFIQTVFGLDEGDVGGVYESNVALHIVLVTDKRSARILGLDDPILPGETATVRQQIRTQLAAQKEQQALAAAVEDVVTDLRDEAEVTVYDQNLPW